MSRQNADYGDSSNNLLPRSILLTSFMQEGLDDLMIQVRRSFDLKNGVHLEYL